MKYRFINPSKSDDDVSETGGRYPDRHPCTKEILGPHHFRLDIQCDLNVERATFCMTRDKFPQQIGHSLIVNSVAISRHSPSSYPNRALFVLNVLNSSFPLQSCLPTTTVLGISYRLCNIRPDSLCIY